MLAPSLAFVAVAAKSGRNVAALRRTAPGSDFDDILVSLVSGARYFAGKNARRESG
ncbi:hypothetical protein [Paraburkholderia lycopersici]|uniref:hypothetical protein n=1 Tax=Paraburkholderia lycopersici TaxID=416944 RepID=UPI0015A1DD50|nr:hypothetical protein [Paraburkholderia lycopersici]